MNTHVLVNGGQHLADLRVGVVLEFAIFQHVAGSIVEVGLSGEFDKIEIHFCCTQLFPVS